MKKPIFIDPMNEVKFRNEGYLILDLLSAADIVSMLNFFDSVEEMHSGPIGVSVLTEQLPERKAIHEALAPVFAKRLLPILNDYKIAVCSFVVKQRQCAEAKFPLHQDPSFIDEKEQVGVTIWCPLSDVNMENGNLGVVPRSHLLNAQYRTTCVLPYPELETLLEDQYMQYLPMRAGQVLFMDQRMFHGSPANYSDQARIAAIGVGVPCNQPLLCCYVDYFHENKVLEIFEVPSDFYLRNIFGQRPNEGKHIHSIAYQVEELTPDLLAQHFSNL